MGQGNSLLMCMNDSEDRKNDFKSFRSQKKVPGHTIHLINGVPHLSSPWPVSTDSSLYFSPSPVKFEDDPYIISPFDIMSPSLSRDNEMTVVRLKEIASLVQAGDLEGLTFVVAKWHLQYKDIRIDDMPLLHLAVISNHFPIVKFLIFQDVDVNAVDQEGMAAIDHAVSCKDLSIYPYLKSAACSETKFAPKLDITKTVSESDTDRDDFPASSSSSANSSCKISYLSSMDVKKLRTKKEKKKLLKQTYLSTNVDGEESVDDDKSPRKGRRAPQASRLLSEQLLSPLSQSTTETTYSTILESDHFGIVEQPISIETLAEEQDKITSDEKQAGEIFAVMNDKLMEDDGALQVSEIIENVPEVMTEPTQEEEIEPTVIFSECKSPVISPESSTSSFVTAKTTSKSPAFKKIKKAAGRAFSFVAGGTDKKTKTPKIKAGHC